MNSIFVPIIPMQWIMEGMILRTPYRATWQSIYYRVPGGSTSTGEVEGYNRLIPEANLRNTHMKGTSLVTPNTVYTDWGIELTGVDVHTYVSIDYLFDGHGLIQAFGYDRDHIYVGGRKNSRNDRQPFDLYYEYMASNMLCSIENN